MPQTTPPPSPRVRAIRQHDRARYDRSTIDAILDEALVAHLGFAIDDQPYVIPTLHARVGDRVFVHGSAASRALRRAGTAGVRACLTVTLIDGLVLARSVFEHDVQYRSAVLLGELRPVDDPDEKLRALEAFTEAVLPGRWNEARSPSRQELKATSILAMPIDEASAKVAADGPEDADGPDGALDVWAGWIPTHTTYGDPVPDPALRDGIPESAAARRLVAAARARGAGPGAAG
ncbi:pyridoxamine 5'-phosphate oxidase family protein [Patulibacter sp. SYSU D01012]|uniref:pyridoxamine 5'-phosphate oxidase family protein n=1 Tax=Patulibacter sp. SYSU D01012 TaxID=2817381 RepID=UPI001B300DCB|nr:pyridoxamine 5'-phosphate oxidase family protein [Patulibacter sp. SYSU D01012]